MDAGKTTFVLATPAKFAFAWIVNIYCHQRSLVRRNLVVEYAIGLSAGSVHGLWNGACRTTIAKAPKELQSQMAYSPDSAISILDMLS